MSKASVPVEPANAEALRAASKALAMFVQDYNMLSAQLDSLAACLDAIERRMTRAVCVEPGSGDAWAWVVNMRPDVPEPPEEGVDYGGGTFMEAVASAMESK